MEFRLLGSIEVWAGERRLSLGGAKPRALLAALLLDAGHVVPVTRLVDVMWGNDPPDNARGMIQTYVSTLRQTFTQSGLGRIIVTQSPGYLARVAPESLDHHVFERLCAEGRARAAAGDHREASRLLGQALALWRGPALGSEKELLPGEAARLEELRVCAWEERIAADLALDHSDHLVPELAALTQRYPANERLIGQQMLVLHRLGRQADALAAYRRGREHLVAELGIEPGAELTELHLAILRGDPRLLAHDGCAAHEELPCVPAQLPRVPTDFTGRAQQCARLREALVTPHAQIQVIVGPGGSGKSTLAAHVAQQLAWSFPDGQLYAELGAMGAVVAEPGEVLGRFLRSLGVAPTAIPQGADERSQLYRTLLASRRLLVLLDDAATESQVRPLLPGSPRCAVLITSRVRLAGLAGTSRMELAMLADADAVAFLGQLAGDERVRAEPESAARILGYCENLPLAIRVVGARLAARPRLPLRVLADRLADESHRLNELAAGDLGVRTTISLSCRTLDPRALCALRRLGFLGVATFSSWLIAWLLGIGWDEAETAAERLVDAQLISFIDIDPLGYPRYRMHDLVRLYARELAHSAEEPDELAASVARAVSAWLVLIERASAGWPTAEGRWHRLSLSMVDIPEELAKRVMHDPRGWFEAEQAALVVGAERAAALGMHELALGFASARNLPTFIGANRFEVRGRLIHAALGATRRAGDARGAAMMLTEWGWLRYDQDRYAEARALFRQALQGFVRIDDRLGRAVALAGLGSAYREPGRLAEAVRHLESSARLLQTQDNVPGVGYVLRMLGSVRMEQGDYDRALSDLDSSLAAYRRCGSRRGVGFTLRTLSLYHRARGDYARAAQVAGQSLQILHELGDQLGEAYAARAVAKARLRMGRFDVLTRLEEVLATLRTLDDRFGEGATLRVLGELHLAAGRLDLAQVCLDAAMAIWHSTEAPLWRARTQRDLALLAEVRGEPERAALLRAEALRVFRQLGAREASEMDSSKVV